MPRRRMSDAGFTLIEIMVVVLIIAVLVAIAMPSFQGFRVSAQNRAAEASLRTAELTSRAILLDDSTVPDTADMIAALEIDENAIVWLDGAVSSTGPNEVSVEEAGSNTELALASMSESGTCYYMRLEVQGATLRKLQDDAESCRASDYTTGADEGW